MQCKKARTRAADREFKQTRDENRFLHGNKSRIDLFRNEFVIQNIGTPEPASLITLKRLSQLRSLSRAPSGPNLQLTLRVFVQQFVLGNLGFATQLNLNGKLVSTRFTCNRRSVRVLKQAQLRRSRSALIDNLSLTSALSEINQRLRHFHRKITLHPFSPETSGISRHLAAAQLLMVFFY